MTYKERIDKEDRNHNCLILYKEGIFFKAYEQSAYVCHTRIAPFQLKVKTLKDVEQPYITLGFPQSQQEKYLSGLRIIEENPEYLIAELPEPINKDAFVSWKLGVLQEFAKTVMASAATQEPSSDAGEGAERPDAQPERELTEENAALAALLNKVLDLNLAAMTPMAAFNFLYQFQTDLKQISTNI